MLQRALVRQEIPLRYSQGFNPRPRMSLPLPRSVGVGSDDEVLCAMVEFDGDYDLDDIRQGLSRQLPDQCVIKEVSIRPLKVTLQPLSAVYEFSVKPSAITENLTASLRALQKAAGGKMPVIVERKSGKRKSFRRVDVSAYIGSLELEDGNYRVKCMITPSGSIRIDELMQQLGITAKDLSGPVKRTSVQWSDC